jgi:hypothetical protein
LHWPGQLAAHHLTDQPRKDHGFAVDLTQQAGGEEPLHRSVRRSARCGVPGPAHRRALQQPLQQLELRRVERLEPGGDIRLLAVLDGGLTGIPGQARRGLGGDPHRRVAPDQRALPQVVHGGGDGVLARLVPDQRQQFGQRHGRGVRMQHEQRVDHRQPQEVESVGGGLDRLPGLRAGRQRRDRAWRRLGQVGPQLQQPDQPLVVKLGQPGAEGNARSSFGHC